MEKVLNQLDEYLAYILRSIVEDVNGFDHWWMWLILPAVFWIVIILIKYLLLTCPFWIVFAILLQSVRGIFYYHKHEHEHKHDVKN